ncbi:Transposon Tf2-7 polyprotein [Rhizoctonia solani]|uniref:Transposon Tf2-7 polyprotein n=1 Tax=Rhizoctonia solani TaxID=456999 RepID=A0A8H8P199_9AGAM|nr:Transposon Tf2-7 polyprotein [Rhizoctonia solani]QRW23225.1 Transposon Tf2-7 polyprotein [Rhizoctonia solani]
MKVHPVFNIALLHKKPVDEYDRDPVPLPPVVTADGEEEYTVERILDSKKDNTWEPKAHLANAPEKLAKFHHEHPEAAGP